jgi:aminomuconate-semialdehyde/2-hydroxymuconate-6-semialdehyde dehydrogenase
VDFEKTVAGALRAAFTNNGQVCLCGSRIFVQRPLYARFLAEFVRRAAAMRCGPPQEPTTDVGPVSSAGHW